MNFLNSVSGGSCLRVAQQLSRGQDPNVNYIGITPLSMAVENGDVDMVALLLNWKADPSVPYYNGKTPQREAEKMAADEKCKFREEAAEMLKLMADEKAVNARLVQVKAKIEVMRKHDAKQMERFVLGVLLVSAVIYGFIYAKSLFTASAQQADTKEL